ncbi:helix-turn-helix transcriptional regulator [Futiania mangrovi]|uniref:Shikimate kinase n=1 Tax=Futiania mangrovi TaxID=2959716 RepID=A0A9J6PA31_9PROT|nr:helix-turn-helix transcriptional regulator [Futiania mangrovii]MCP1335861.1 helix-turn-helix transcriptional regulator [Futiania mangrovii]
MTAPSVRAGDGASDDAAFLALVGQRVRTARTRLSMSRKMLAQASGVSERYLAQLETGAGNISILLLRQVARATGRRLEDFVDESGGAGDAELLSLLDAVRQATPEERARLSAILTEMRRGGGGLKAGRFALIGLRGAGKSTLGRAVAERMGLPFVELNREIEAESGLAIAEIFSLYGQDGYRRLEQRCLKLVVARHRACVLAVAGGIVAEPETFEMLLDAFHTVWLRATPEEHMERVRAQGDRRPMAGNPSAMDELRAILDARERLYSRAEARLDTSHKSVEASAAELANLLEDLTEPAVA